jgi:large subunit ribosomal protein L31
MKSAIHPTYFVDAKIVCSCGNTFVSGSTKQEIRVEICSNCHPVYTGVKRFVDTLGLRLHLLLKRRAMSLKRRKPMHLVP